MKYEEKVKRVNEAFESFIKGYKTLPELKQYIIRIIGWKQKSFKRKSE